MATPTPMTDHLRNMQAVLCAACFVAITQLANREHLSRYQKAAIICFAVAMPIFASRYLMRFSETTLIFHIYDQLGGWATVLFVVGMIALIFSFGCLPGWLFVMSTVLAWAGLHVGRRRSN